MAKTNREAKARALEAVKTQPTCSLDEAAIVLGISRSMAYKAAKEKEIETIRMGARWIVITAPLRKALSIAA